MAEHKPSILYDTILIGVKRKLLLPTLPIRRGSLLMKTEGGAVYLNYDFPPMQYGQMTQSC